MNSFLSAYLNTTLNNNDISIHNFTVEDIQKLDYFAKAFETIIFEDLEKVTNNFIKFLLRIDACILYSRIKSNDSKMEKTWT